MRNHLHHINQKLRTHKSHGSWSSFLLFLQSFSPDARLEISLDPGIFRHDGCFYYEYERTISKSRQE